MSPVTTAIPHFTEAELACKCCGTIKLHPSFAVELPKLRDAAGRPLIPSSVCRCPSRNVAVEGHPHSLHLTVNPKRPTLGTAAADIRWWAWPVEEKKAFAKLARSMGWAVGLHNSFVHVDRRGDIGLEPTTFYYGQWGMFFRKQDIA